MYTYLIKHMWLSDASQIYCREGKVIALLKLNKHDNKTVNRDPKITIFQDHQNASQQEKIMYILYNYQGLSRIPNATSLLLLVLPPAPTLLCHIFAQELTISYHHCRYFSSVEPFSFLYDEPM